MLECYNELAILGWRTGGEGDNTSKRKKAPLRRNPDLYKPKFIGDLWTYHFFINLLVTAIRGGIRGTGS